jgi:hypothetical protein
MNTSSRHPRFTVVDDKYFLDGRDVGNVKPDLPNIVIQDLRRELHDRPVRDYHRGLQEGAEGKVEDGSDD